MYREGHPAHDLYCILDSEKRAQSAFFWKEDILNGPGELCRNESGHERYTIEGSSIYFVLSMLYAVIL